MFIKVGLQGRYMAVTLSAISQELHQIRKDVEFIKRILSEDFELSDEAKRALKEARETPESEYRVLV